MELSTHPQDWISCDQCSLLTTDLQENNLMSQYQDLKGGRPDCSWKYNTMLNRLAGQPVFQSNSQPAGQPAHDSASHAADPLSKTNLYIRGLAPNTMDEDLYKLCYRFGKILSTKVINDPMTNKCKGYGFVDFETSETAEAALVALEKQGIQVQMARLQEQDPTNLYFGNLPSYFTEVELEALLCSFGRVISARILRELSGKSRRIGFTRMESKQQCEAIIQAYNGKVLQDLPISAKMSWMPNFVQQFVLEKEPRVPLIVKFADGGTRKRIGLSLMHQKILAKNSISGVFSGQIQAMNSCSSVVPVSPVPSAGMVMSAFPSQNFPVNNYSELTPYPGWYHQVDPQYLMPFAVTQVLPLQAMSPNGSSVSADRVHHLTTHLGQVDLRAALGMDQITGLAF